MDWLAALNQALEFCNEILWGPWIFVVLLSVGIVFSVWSKFVQFRALTHGVQVVRGKYDDKHDPGAINHFQALSTALSGTVGLGNIGGVALAIGLGGPGALFWMWVTGFLGMAIKSVEVTLSMIYRDTTNPDDPHGGAMYVIKRGWGDKVGGIALPLSWLIGAIFAITLLIATVTGGNMFQVWNVGNITNENFGVPTWVSGVIIAVVTGLVIVGGIKRIGDVTGMLVPFMCGSYLLAGIVVLFVEAANVPSLLIYVVRDAFSPTTAGGAFIGAGAWYGLTTGLKRALFSNEAGQGSSPIAHAAAKTDEPVREGVVAGLEPFIDTCLVCTLTALVILATGTWNREPVGPFKGRVALVADAAHPEQVRIEGDTDQGLLPDLAYPDKWLADNGFYLIAESPTLSQDTGTNLVKLRAVLVKTDNGEGLAIRWDKGLLPAGTQLRDLGVHRDLIGASLTGHAFDRAIPGLGKWLVTLTCWLFAISTIISWSYYGEQGVVFLAGRWLVTPYKLIYCALAVVSTLPGFITTDKELDAWAMLGTGCMLFANVPIVVFMAPQAMRAFREYFGRLDAGTMDEHAAPPITKVIEGDDVE